MPRKTKIQIYETPHQNTIITIGRKMTIWISGRPTEIDIDNLPLGDKFKSECKLIIEN